MIRVRCEKSGQAYPQGDMPGCCGAAAKSEAPQHFDEKRWRRDYMRDYMRRWRERRRAEKEAHDGA